jgi:peptide-methionine (S)-S-oxide reductase
MKATFGAGCFWHVEALFRQVKGVKSTTVGYLGGTLKDPTYEDVCSGQTGHAEVVQIEYDPAVVSYDDFLTVFWNNHDPTTLNRQGPDVGVQYRSAIFFHNTEQEAAAKISKEKLQNSAKFKNKKIVTEISQASQFYKAEEYHQQYFEKCGLH